MTHVAMPGTGNSGVRSGRVQAGHTMAFGAAPFLKAARRALPAWTLLTHD